jgi:transcriptional regulator with XRE-family HTH domain
MSATQLSRISGVPATTIYALERGTARNGRIDTIELLADALRISIDEYIGRRR